MTSRGSGYKVESTKLSELIILTLNFQLSTRKMGNTTRLQRCKAHIPKLLSTEVQS